MPWWTGFLTSRPEFKQKYHAASAVLRAVSQLHSFARDESAWLSQFAALRVLWEGVSMVQHHDAITGDAHDFVEDDWLFNYVTPGLSNASVVAAAAVSSMGGPSAAALCLNASYIPCASVAAALTAGKPVTLTVHNPLAWAREEVVDLLVPVPAVSVVDAATGSPAQGQVSPAVAEDVEASGLPPGTWFMLSFVAAGIPPLGWRTFTITPVSASDSIGAAAALPLVAPVVPNGPFVVANGNASVSFDAIGNVQSMSTDGAAIDVTAAALYYASGGECPERPHAAATSVALSAPSFGARCGTSCQIAGGVENLWDFSTNASPGNSAQPFDASAQSATLIDGPIVKEVRVSVNAAAGIRLRWRLLVGDAAPRLSVGTGPFNTTTPGGPVSIDGILRFNTSLTGNAPTNPNVTGYGPVWYVDSNGLELQRHALNWRPFAPGQFYQDPQYPVACQYAPWTAGIFIANSTNAEAAGAGIAVGAGQVAGSTPGAADGSVFGLVTANSLGGASLAAGVLETMVNRAIVGSDGTPAGAIRHNTQELAVLVAPGLAAATGAWRQLATRMTNPVVLMASTGGALPVPVWSPIAAPLPAQVQLLTLQTLPPGLNVSAAPAPPSPLASAAVLVRLRNVYAGGEGGHGWGASGTVSVDLSTMLAPSLDITAALELTADATQPLSEARAAQISWVQAGGTGAINQGQQRDGWLAGGDLVVSLQPMAIRTFLVQVAA